MGKKINSRDMGVDFLRGASILYIVGFWHMLNYTDAIPEYNNLVTYRVTWIVLGTFVFISGYFMGKKEIEIEKKSLMSFYKNRVLRIYPLYLLSLITFTYLGMSDFMTSLKAALVLSMFFKPAPPTLWFITMLMFFYTISPFLMSACRKLKIMNLVMIYFVVSVLLMLYFVFTRLLDIRILMYLPAFVFGLIVSMDETGVSEKKSCLILALVVGIIVSFLTNTSYKQVNFLLSIPMVTTAPYFLFTMFRKKSASLQKIGSIISILSYSSYCMYLFHRPIYIVARRLYFPESGVIQLIYLVAFCLPCIGLFSFCIQKLYDTANREFANKPVSVGQSG